MSCVTHHCLLQENRGETRMDVIDSEIGYLGYHESESYGLVWKVSVIVTSLRFVRLLGRTAGEASVCVGNSGSMPPSHSTEVLEHEMTALSTVTLALQGCFLPYVPKLMCRAQLLSVVASASYYCFDYD